MPVTILDDILISKVAEVNALGSIEELKTEVANLGAREIRKAKWSSGLDVIAEIKRKSPSKGDLAPIEDPGSLAKSYESGGASIISVLTDSKYFGAREADFNDVRKATSLPILRKDFIIDEKQIYQSYIMGADLVLLIVAAFEDTKKLIQLYRCATELGLGVLLETHNEQEVQIANQLEAQIIGVNVRDLKSFVEDPLLGDLLIGQIRKESISVWESSITSIEQAKKAKLSGACAVLIGQGLVQSENPAKFIQQIRSI